MFKKITLENGLRILTAPMQGTNTVAILILCGTGSDYETKRENGISHFLEHMFFKGTERRPTPGGLKEELDAMGGISNAFTSHETTGYYIKAGTPYLERGLDILADIYKHSLLEEPEIEKEKQVVVEEMHRNRDDPASDIWRHWERLIYGDQPAGWDVAGDEETVRQFRRDDLHAYFTHQYVAGNTAVVVTGNIDETGVLERVREHFADIRHSPPRTRPAVTGIQTTPQLHPESRKTDQTHVIVGFRGYDAFHPKRYAADLLATVLGGGWSSRMFRRIREELGLAYAVFTDSENFSNRGYLVTYAGVAHENAERATEEILGEYRRIRDAGVREDELARTKDFIKGRMLMALETSNAVASFVGGEEMLTGTPLTAEEVLAKLDAVGAEDIAAVARDRFKPETLNMVVLGPEPDSQKFEAILSRFS